MKTVRYLSLVALLAVVLFGSTDAVGQAIPVDIPDTPDESPVDREREKRAERHHATWSRFFGTTSISASPVLTGPGLYFDTVLEGGVEIYKGDALYFTIGARMPTDEVAVASEGSKISQRDAAGEIFAIGYEMGLARFSAHPVIARSTLSLSVGGFTGNVDMLYVDVSPRYIVRANRYWSLPVGFRVTNAFLSSHATPIATVGITAGIRRHFGQRKSLK